ncbi:DUF58 domain-containing protein [Halocalculus aciditolerans]|uniref:DUF58 domain-containing protein n=1 Tax=Halocalculus aciditolerans TaxID=1383812 RepID=A0A830FN71_9EURY|nr:DUF58 domain-containing protein [Halocalculus aciditolerans]GGL63554.1 DUF58 domain-containing protein [Halocalculus aciditolerans]
MKRPTNRWAGVGVVIFAGVAVAAVTRSPGALVAAAVGVLAAGYANATTAPSPALAVSRDVSPENPDPGDDVTVRVTVENEGGFLPDLRVVDGVPDALRVTDGSPRHATALRAGATATFTYTVEATRGRHEWAPLDGLARDAAGSTETRTEANAETRIECVPPLTGLDAFPLHDTAAGRVGRLATDTGGSGTEFYAVRDYRAGDPMNRVDWRRLARSGDLATVEFREERAADVLVVVDTRDDAYVADPDAATAVERCVEAAGGVLAVRLDAGDRVGLASLGPRFTYHAPNTGRDHRARLREALATDDGFAPEPGDERTVVYRIAAQLRKRVKSGTQVVFCSPLADDSAAEFVRRLAAAGHPVTVVSPEPAPDGDADSRTRAAAGIAAAERRLRLGDLRSAGVRVVDWPGGVPLPVAVARAKRGWRS